MENDDRNEIINSVEAGENRESATGPRKRHRPVWMCVLGWTGGILLGFVVLVVLFLAVATWWFNPRRLAEFISKEASENIEADVHLSEVRYTFWSTFPHLSVEIDSISVRSRTLDSVPDSVKSLLPANADFLLSARQFRGGVNLLRLMSGRIYLKDIDARDLKVNLVAVTDSLNNYEIVASGGKSKVPYFHIDGLKISDGGNIAYTSVPTSTDALVTLSGVQLEPGRKKHREDTYNLQLDGKVEMRSNNLEILHDFPFSLAGDVDVSFDPFRVSTNDYRIALGNIQGEVSMDLNIGDTPRMNRFAYRMSNFTMSDLRTFLPPGNYPALDHLHADLTLDASARLTSPYIFASAWLPSVEVDFRVPEGKVSYTLSGGRTYEMNRVGMTGRLMFDGKNPEASYVEIPDLVMSGNGIDMLLDGRVSSLTTTPEISARLVASSDLARLTGMLPELKPYNLRGDVDVNADVHFRVEDGTLYGALADLRVSGKDASMKYGTTVVSVKDFMASTNESYADALTAGAVRNRIPLQVKFDAGAVEVNDKSQGVNFKADNVKVSGELGRHGNGNVMREVKLNTSAGDVALNASGMQIGLNGVRLDFEGKRLANPIRTSDYVMPAHWERDSRTRGFVKHTPEYLQVSLPDAIKQLMAQWQARLDVRSSGGVMGTGKMPRSTRIGKIDLTVTGDSVDMRSLTMGSGATRGTLSARITNLRQFLNSKTPAPLRVSLKADIDTVQINQLAREYTRHNPQSAIARGDKEAMAGPDDSTALLIPRNLYMDITATARQTRYINLHLYNLLAKMRIADGRADIDTLRIGSDFGEAGLNMTFDTSDLQDMSMRAHLDISDVNIVNFFKNFQKLLIMMPEGRNISGMLSAGVDARLRIFPSMYLNVPSISADARVTADNIAIKQSPFLKKITRMLLLPDDATLHIDDISVHAGVHSNLLEVYPFTFEMSKYKLVLGGVNNFNGQLYYHIGVADWPLRIPFGINIKGDFHDPKLHFGGKSWHDRNGAEITLGVDDNNRINVTKMGKRYAGEFVHTAATYEGE